MLQWIRRIHQHGVTKKLAQDLNLRLEEYPLTAFFSFDAASKKIVPKYAMPKNMQNAGNDFAFTFYIASYWQRVALITSSDAIETSAASTT